MYKLDDILIKNKIDNISCLKTFLEEYKNINIIENDNFMILSLKNLNKNNLTKLEYNSYFTIISKNPFRLIYYLSDYVYVNDNCINLLCKYKLLNYKFDIYESLNGHMITLFNYKGDWVFISSSSLDNDFKT